MSNGRHPNGGFHSRFTRNRNYIARQNPQTAKRLSHRLVDRALTLKLMPEIGRKVQEWPGVRVLQEKPYLIFYRVNSPKQTIEVLRFWHGKRDQSLFRP